MRIVYSLKRAQRAACVFFILLLAFSPAALAQEAAAPALPQAGPSRPVFRLERTPVAGGAELLTIFGELGGLAPEKGQSSEVPHVSVVRDTLGDENPDNDRLRYVWMLTYTKPSFGQRLASAIPFLYTRVGNKTKAG